MRLQEANDNNLNELISSSTLPVVVLFVASWCGPSKSYQPTVEYEAEDMERRYKFLIVDVDDSPERSKQYGIRVTPTLMIFENGEKRRELVGGKRKEDLQRFLNK